MGNPLQMSQFITPPFEMIEYGDRGILVAIAIVHMLVNGFGMRKSTTLGSSMNLGLV
jgi:hypothetical protein